MSSLSYDFFIPIEHSAVRPCDSDSAVQIRKSVTAPPKGGGTYKNTQKADMQFESRNQSAASRAPSRTEGALCFKSGGTAAALPTDFLSFPMICDPRAAATPRAQAAVHAHIRLPHYQRMVQTTCIYGGGWEATAVGATHISPDLQFWGIYKVYFYTTLEAERRGPPCGSPLLRCTLTAFFWVTGWEDECHTSSTTAELWVLSGLTNHSGMCFSKFPFFF